MQRFRVSLLRFSQGAVVQFRRWRVSLPRESHRRSDDSRLYDEPRRHEPPTPHHAAAHQLEVSRWSRRNMSETSLLEKVLFFFFFFFLSSYPVFDCDLWRWNVFDFACVDHVQVLCVTDDGFFFQITNNAMAQSRTCQIRKEEDIEEGQLVKGGIVSVLAFVFSLELRVTCTDITSARSRILGCWSLMNVSRCIRSFSASSSSSWIQPPSCCMRRRLRRWRNTAPTMPGTAATVSRTIARCPYRFPKKRSAGILSA